MEFDGDTFTEVINTMQLLDPEIKVEHKAFAMKDTLLRLLDESKDYESKHEEFQSFKDYEDNRLRKEYERGFMKFKLKHYGKYI